MKRKIDENQFEESIHHMEMACLMNDTKYLYREVHQFLKFNNLTTISEENMVQLKNVSLEAAMEGRVECLKCLYEMEIPLDELCPVIAGCHGHKNVIEFCLKNGMDCTEAWNRYFNWILLNPTNNNQENGGMYLMMASEWIRDYNRNHMQEIIIKT